MAREFKTEKYFDKILQEKDIAKTLKALKPLLYDSKGINDVPSINNENGSLWLDKSNDGELKFLNNGKWDILFKNKFALVDQVMEPRPLNPVYGQFWIDKENQVLMYFDGTSWKDVRAFQNPTEHSVGYFRDFLMLGPLKPNGDKVVKDSVVKSQFLIPSVKLDKVFIDGEYSNNFEKVSSVSIQCPDSHLANKNVMDIHVNPQRLVNIKRALINIDKSRIINVSETNTEFYGIKDNFGTFLNKTNTAQTDYITYGNGIKISEKVAKKYDFVLALTYQFATARTEGKLFKSSIDYVASNSSLYIGTIPEDKVTGVFMGGLCLNEADQEYSFNKENGYLNFNTKSSLDTTVMLFNKKQEGKLQTYNKEKEAFQIDLFESFKKPLLYVSGIGLYEELGEFEHDKSNNKLYIKNAKKGMAFTVFECEDKFIETGIVGKTNSIKYNHAAIDFKKGEEPIVFVNGLYIPNTEIEINIDGDICIYGLKKGMEYNILKDNVTVDELGNKASDIVFKGSIRYVTVPTYKSNVSLVYVQGLLLNDASCAIKSTEPIKGYENQVIKCINSKETAWKIYKSGVWQTITDEEKIKRLDKSVVGYLKNEDTIHIMPVLQEENKIAQCNIYSYKFANTIEKPLQYGGFKLKNNVTPKDGSYNYPIQYNHFYQPSTNSISVWINGIKQYITKDIDTNTIGLLSNPNSLPNNDVKDHEAFYLLERPEYGESKSCERVIATKVRSCRNIYTTNDVSMAPGNIRVFVGGLRQPKEAFALLDDFTLLLKGDIMDNTEMINGKEELVRNYIEKDEHGNIVSYKKIKQTKEDSVLIEIRQDYKISELTIEPRRENQTEFTCKDDGIPESLIECKDSVIYYINGICHGPVHINKDKKSINIAEEFNKNEDLAIKKIKNLYNEQGSKFCLASPKKDLTEFDKLFIRYRKNHGMSQHEAENIKPSNNILQESYKRKKDKITFEWR